MTILRSDPRARRPSTVRTKSPFFRLDDGPGLRTGPVQQVAGTTCQIAQHGLEQVLEIAALGRRTGPLQASGGGGGLDGHQALLKRLEARCHLQTELMHRRVESGRVEQHRELGRVAIEVTLQHPADPADGAIAFRFIEQLVDHRPQRTAVAEKLLQCPRQAPIAIGEVGPQGLLQRLGGLLIDRLGLANQLLELGAYDVHVDRDPGVLERQQSDPKGSLDEVRSVIAGAFREVCRKGRIVQDQALHHDPVAIDADTRTGRRHIRAGDDG